MLSISKLQKKNRQGFTLIELLVVIGIIGLLTTVGMVALQNAREKSRDAKRKSDMRQLYTALGLYFNGVGNGNYPTQATFACLSSATDLVNKLTTVQANNPPIMATLPSDPLTSRIEVGTGCYAYRGGNQDFKLIVALENDTTLMAGDGGSTTLTTRYEIYTPGAQIWDLTN